MKLKQLTSLLVLTCSVLLSTAQSHKLLVFTKTDGYRHESIPHGVSALKALGKTYDFSVTHSEDAAVFTNNNLMAYDAVVFLNTTENIFNKKQQKAFKQYINDGGGFIGIHAAADTEYNWPWYNKLVGAYFKSHPDQQKALIKISDIKHPATAHLGTTWQHFDEWYNFKNISTSLTVLATLDESSYKGGENGVYHPISWCQNFEGGKMFYTGLGHTIEAYKDPLFLKHLLGGIQYVLDK